MKHEIKHLSVAEIIALHDKAISLFGGLPGCPDVGRLDALMGRVFNFIAYENITDLHAIAAMYCVAIARGHVFNDGYKRTAINSALLFARRNGLFLAYRKDMADFVVKVAEGKVSASQLADYFRSLPRRHLAGHG